MAHAASLNEYTFKMQGLHCVKCIRKVQSVAGDFSSIENVKVDLGDQIVTTKTKPNFPVESFVFSLKKHGFSVLSVEKKVSGSKDHDAGSRQLLKRIGVAGACAGNIMILSVADYSGAIIEGWPYLFKAFSFVLFLPVLLYSAVPLYSSAWHSLRRGKLSVDAPIALAVVGGFTFGGLGLLQTSQAPVYFDSIAMFVFFLLGSRYLVQRVQSKYTSQVSVQDIYQQSRVKRVQGKDIEAVDAETVCIGDELSVSHGEFICFDGDLLSDSALISDAFFSGEAYPKQKMRGDKVYAGSKNLGRDLAMVVTADQDRSRVSGIVKLVNKSLQAETPLATLADQGAHLLTLTIFSLAALVLCYFGWVVGDIAEGTSRALALLVVACPCGLAIAIPLVQTVAVRRGFASSLLIKDVSVFEKASEVEAVFFDKTGTLTEGDIQVTGVNPRDASPLEKQILFSLESVSEHPVAQAIRHHVGAQPPIDIQNTRETVGHGVSGSYLGHMYEVTVDEGDRRRVVFRVDGTPRLYFEISDAISIEARSLVSTLQERDITVYVLSGDNRAETLRVASSLEIPESHVYFEKSPNEKTEIVSSFPGQVLYCGDGVNDSMAMRAACISVSVSSSANVAFKSSGVHILSGGIGKILKLFDLASQSLMAMRAIVLLSLAYNLVFAGFAVLGLIHPLIAVLLMPTSSLTVTFLGLYFMRKVPNQKAMRL